MRRAFYLVHHSRLLWVELHTLILFDIMYWHGSFSKIPFIHNIQTYISDLKTFEDNLTQHEKKTPESRFYIRGIRICEPIKLVFKNRIHTLYKPNIRYRVKRPKTPLLQFELYGRYHNMCTNIGQ